MVLRYSRKPVKSPSFEVRRRLFFSLDRFSLSLRISRTLSRSYARTTRDRRLVVVPNPVDRSPSFADGSRPVGPLMRFITLVGNLGSIFSVYDFSLSVSVVSEPRLPSVPREASGRVTMLGPPTRVHGSGKRMRLLKSILRMLSVAGSLGVVGGFFALTGIVVDIEAQKDERVLNSWSILRETAIVHHQYSQGLPQESRPEQSLLFHDQTARVALEFLNSKTAARICSYDRGPPKWFFVAIKWITDLKRDCVVSSKERERFTGIYLERVNLANGELYQSDFRDARLSGANLSGANLAKADFTEAKLSRVDLTGATLVDAVMFDTDLRSAALCDADLRGADLREADLSGADLSRAKISGVKWYNATVSGAKLPIEFDTRQLDDISEQNNRPDVARDVPAGYGGCSPR